MSTETFVNHLIDDAEALEETIKEYANRPDRTLEMCFTPLFPGEYKPKILSLQKKRRNYLRLYAIKIDENCYVIMGGAIKLTQTMQQHPETCKELKKLNQCKAYLQEQGVCDDSSFFELLSE